MVYDILLDKNTETSDSRSSPKAHALLMSFLQVKTDQKCNTSKIHSMAASFILLSFLAFLISLSQFFSCMCGHICSIFLFLFIFHVLFMTCSKGILKLYSHLHLLFACSFRIPQVWQYRKKKNYVINMGLAS